MNGLGLGVSKHYMSNVLLRLKSSNSKCSVEHQELRDGNLAHGVYLSGSLGPTTCGHHFFLGEHLGTVLSTCNFWNSFLFGQGPQLQAPEQVACVRILQ